MPKRQHRGAVTIEMTLVGIPLMFMLISVFEISRGMWMYHTTAHAVKQGVRYAIVHGADCVNSKDNPNSCAKKPADIAQQIWADSAGLNNTATLLTFKAGGSTSFQCHLDGTDIGGATDCATAPWPPATYNGIGSPIEIDIETPFISWMSRFFPVASPGWTRVGSTNLWASSNDVIQF